MPRFSILLADLVPPEPPETPAGTDFAASITTWLLISGVALVVIIGILLLRRTQQGS